MADDRKIKLPKVKTPKKLMPSAYQGRAFATRFLGNDFLIIAADDETLKEIWHDMSLVSKDLNLEQVKPVLVCMEAE